LCLQFEGNDRKTQYDTRGSRRSDKETLKNTHRRNLNEQRNQLWKVSKKLGKPKLDEKEEKQRPDIQFWADISNDEEKFETWKLYIIEISVPFGKGDQEDEHSNTLKKVIEFKTNK
jgi:hypothetical protein